VLFEAGHLSVVRGLELADGRQVVVKARPPEARLAAGVQVQRHLRAGGFPCPELLAGPAPLGALVATAEAYVPGGAPLPPGPDAPRLYTTALAASVALAPPVAVLPTRDGGIRLRCLQMRLPHGTGAAVREAEPDPGHAGNDAAVASRLRGPSRE
jgi:hypothetical protein